MLFVLFSVFHTVAPTAHPPTTLSTTVPPTTISTTVPPTTQPTTVQSQSGNTCYKCSYSTNYYFEPSGNPYLARSGNPYLAKLFDAMMAGDSIGCHKDIYSSATSECGDPTRCMLMRFRVDIHTLGNALCLVIYEIGVY